MDPWVSLETDMLNAERCSNQGKMINPDKQQKYVKGIKKPPAQLDKLALWSW